MIRRRSPYPRPSQRPAGIGLLCYKSSCNHRPAGVKLHGGALILRRGCKQKTLPHWRQGVWLVGEVGLGVKERKPHRWSLGHQYGMKVMMHTGALLPGSPRLRLLMLTVQPDVASHVNGGPTAPARDCQTVNES